MSFLKECKEKFKRKIITTTTTKITVKEGKRNLFIVSKVGQRVIRVHHDKMIVLKHELLQIYHDK